jgi:hypothetical protein
MLRMKSQYQIALVRAGGAGAAKRSIRPSISKFITNTVSQRPLYDSLCSDQLLSRRASASRRSSRALSRIVSHDLSPHPIQRQCSRVCMPHPHPSCTPTAHPAPIPRPHMDPSHLLYLRMRAAEVFADLRRPHGDPWWRLQQQDVVVAD